MMEQSDSEVAHEVDMYKGVPNTIFNNPAGYTIKHPLSCVWVLHFDDPGRLPPTPTAEDWKNNVKELCSFETVEDFWRVTKNLKTVTSKEIQGSNLHFFKKGIAPEWEDAANEHGGKWVFTGDITDRLWETSMLLLASGLFDDVQEHLCGLVAATRIRRKSKLSLWTNTCDRAICMKIATIWKEHAHIKDTLLFQPHKSAKQSRQSYSSFGSFKC